MIAEEDSCDHLISEYDILYLERKCDQMGSPERLDQPGLVYSNLVSPTPVSF